jgi:hypothetical protein
MYLQGTGAATTWSDRRVTPLGYPDREKTQKWAVLIAPVSTHAPTHASSHNHASAPPSARRRCTHAHTGKPRT